jgi:beta-barrel assembly-enhancing protease
MRQSRRHFIAGGLGGCLMCAALRAPAEVLSTNLQPLMGPDYVPLDADEKGLWQGFERLEEDLAESDLLLRAPEIQEYTVSIVERLMGRPAKDLRVYIVHDASFNASMAPNGMMLVHTGFLARIQSEAQCASVLGHEAGHYFRKHSVDQWRNQRTKGAVMAFVGAGANAVAGYSALQGYDGQSWIDLANAINDALVMSIYSFSRAQESEADAYGVGLMVKAGYSPHSAAEVWGQLIEERRATAQQRGRKYKDNARSAYSTHPPSEDRMRDLAETAAEAERRGLVQTAFAGRSEWRAILAPHLPALLEEQVKLNNPGASKYLIDNHAREGWNGVLRFYEGEVYRLRNDPGDPDLAAGCYAAAVQFPDAPPEAWRAHGYALVKMNRREEGRQSLSRYLELRPDSKDAAMVRFALQQ